MGRVAVEVSPESTVLVRAGGTPGDPGRSVMVVCQALNLTRPISLGGTCGKVYGEAGEDHSEHGEDTGGSDQQHMKGRD